MARPLALLAAFVAVERVLPWWATAPFALAAVFAWSTLVHDLIHNALRLPRRASDLALAVAPLLRALASIGVARAPRRVVDVGCGLGYVLRALAHGRGLAATPGGVELVGVDFNAALVAEAARLAALEGLPVTFLRVDALALEPPAAAYVSTGVLHHFRGAALGAFLRAQMERAAAFAHFDFQPSPAAPFGAWMFHRARFRLELARHDGVLSALRAHDGDALVRAALAGAPAGWRVALFGARLIGPVPRVFHALVGARVEAWGAFVAELGPRASRLGPAHDTGGAARP